MNKKDKNYKDLINKMNEVFIVPPQDLGWASPYFKLIVPYLKEKPAGAITLFSFLVIFIFYFLFGAKVVKMASLLQSGF